MRMYNPTLTPTESPNPKGTMQDFNAFWDAVQQEKDKLQVAFILL